MIKVLFIFLIGLCMQVFTCTADCCSETFSSERIHVKYQAIVFSGATATERFSGQFNSELFPEWFTQNYSVGGERIETPLDAVHLGVLVLQNRNDLILMPISTWTTSGGNKYFACQSESIGLAPKFSVCIECKSVNEFFAQLRGKLVGLARQNLTLNERADAAVAEIKRIRGVAKTGSPKDVVRRELGEPNSIENFESDSITQTWRYDIDNSVYILVNFNAGVIVGTSSSGIRELIGSDD